jgi:hypothetical protein
VTTEARQLLVELLMATIRRREDGSGGESVELTSRARERLNHNSLKSVESPTPCDHVEF